jgi:hypothetical protein
MEESDGVWEDVVENEGEEVPPMPTTPSPTGSVTRSSPRKRKSLHRTTYIATPPRKVATLPIPKQLRPPRNIIAAEDIVNGAVNGTSFTLRYLFDIFSTAIKLLRRPLYFIVFLWMLSFIITRVQHTLWSAFGPLCYLPGLHSSRLCRAPDSVGTSRGRPRWADYPKLIDVQSTTFEHLLDESVGGSGLSLEIKKAEMATTDLVTLVRVSNLHSRDTLGDTLVEFVDDAKKAGRGLQKLTSKIGGAVDKSVLLFIIKESFSLHLL